jgi:hypothetical protein
MSIDAIKIATGIECANCSTCCYLGSESDGGEPEYSTSWPVCRKFPQYEYLKSFPFRKEMRCWEPEFWVSKFAEEIRTGEDAEVLSKIGEFAAARDKASVEPETV